VAEAGNGAEAAEEAGGGEGGEGQSGTVTAVGRRTTPHERSVESAASLGRASVEAVRSDICHICYIQFGG
jgi:hypothetical protein